ncbi:MAG: Anthranilate phosphoribosyltransferase [uncultured Frankineae bacterium]|uniref:Anthranilate phosphoribosyltransferase n=1 Tax=uncultured Frankineae bacterium TaxID=437475 RepID=A0A6J4KKB8_9ACTN|nr:MAG: Anthranilate phosphoribosyltransferase [uncultured Frankineae bacterium]
MAGATGSPDRQGRAVGWPSLLAQLLRGEDLTAADTGWVMGELMAGDASPVQVAGFAVALRAKGETAEEVAGLVEVMLDEAAPVQVPGRVVDTCGTGGDRSNTVNLSTMAALVVAGAGVPVVKHGNRAASSACGSADLLEAVGVVVDLPPAAVGPCLAEAGIAFCFAPVFHPGMRHAAVARRDLGVATVFNILGPLTNPSRPAAQAVGVSDRRLAPVMAGVLAARGTSALVFRGDDGLDELTTTGPSTVWVVADGAVSEQSFDPAVLGVERASLEQLRGGDATENARVAEALLAGERGPVRDAVLLNAAAALAAHAGGSAPLEDRLREGWGRAAAALEDGSAGRVLDRWVQVSTALR